MLSVAPSMETPRMCLLSAVGTVWGATDVATMYLSSADPFTGDSGTGSARSDTHSVAADWRSRGDSTGATEIRQHTYSISVLDTEWR